MSHFRWRLADWFCFIACKLRGQRWYLANNVAGVPGNRAADLKQSIWERCVTICSPVTDDRAVWLAEVESELNELGQLAGEAWGHYPPPKDTP